MKSIMALCLLLVFAVKTQARFGQVMYVTASGKDINLVSGFYEFENEDVKVRYAFWAEGGLLGFIIYNKTNKPIYIDWKKSAMVYEGRQMPYYTNKTTSNYTAYGSSYGVGWAHIFNGGSFGTSSSFGSIVAEETVIKQERITFIPPHAYITNAFYNILANVVFSIDREKIEKTMLNDCSVYVAVPAPPVVFRNFLSYSSTENFTTENYIDNEFVIDKVVTMRQNDLITNTVDGGWKSKWKMSNRFYNWEIKRRDLFE